MLSDVRPQQRPRRGSRNALLAALGLVLGVSLAGCYVAPAPGYYGGGPGYYGGPSASIYVAPPYRYGYYGYHGGYRRCWRCW
jgi:hypothetical protein